MVRMLDLPAAISLGAFVAMMSTVPILGSVVGVGADRRAGLGARRVVGCADPDRARSHARRPPRPRSLGPPRVAGRTVLGDRRHRRRVVDGRPLWRRAGSLRRAPSDAAVASHQGHLAAAVSDLVQDPADRAVPNAVDDAPGDTAANLRGRRRWRSFQPPTSEDVVSEDATATGSFAYGCPGRTAGSAAAIVIAVFALVSVATSFQSFIIWFAVAASSPPASTDRSRRCTVAGSPPGSPEPR